MTQSTKTRLDLILDKAEEVGEVNLSIEGAITSEQVSRVVEAAHRRNLTAAFDGSGFLIRKAIQEVPQCPL